MFHESRRVRCRAAWMIVGALLVASCAGASDAGDVDDVDDAVTAADTFPAESGPADTAVSTSATLDVPASDASGAPTLTVDANPNNTLSAVVHVVSPSSVAVQLSATSGDHTVTLPRKTASAEAHRIPLVGMRSERDYAIVAELIGADGSVVDSVTGTFTSGSVPVRFEPYEFSADPERSSPGYTIIEMQRWRDPAAATPQRPFDDEQYLIALDDEGEIVWYYENGPVIGAVEQTATGTFTSYWFPNGMREFDILGNEVGDWQIPLRDADAAEGDEVERAPNEPGVDALEPLSVVSPEVMLELIHHEAYQTPNGNSLALSTAHHRLTPEQREAFCPGDPAPFGLFSDVAVEFDPAGRVLRTWDLWDVVDVDEVPGDEMCNAFFAVDGDRDWTHANALVYDEQRDAVIFSARHTSQVVAMKHLDGEGPQTELLWTFGTAGTMPLVGDVPRYQHAVEVQADGSILLYDNGNGRSGTTVNDPVDPMYSRAVLYAVDDSSADPADWTVTQTWEHRTVDIDGTPLYAPFIGDADRVANGNVLITHGGIGFMVPGNFLHSRIIEVVPDGSSGGDIVWQFDVGTPDALVTTYRAERIESFYVGPDWVTT